MASAQAPRLAVEATCRATPAVSLDQQATYDNCMRSENAARDRLNKSWNKMRANWRSSCLKTTTLGGIPSYVELLTCVEMREAAESGQSGGATGSMTSGRPANAGSGSPNIASPVPGATTSGTAGTTGFPSGPVTAPGNGGSTTNRGLGAGSAGASGRAGLGSGSPTVSSPGYGRKRRQRRGGRRFLGLSREQLRRWRWRRPLRNMNVIAIEALRTLLLRTRRRPTNSF